MCLCFYVFSEFPFLVFPVPSAHRKMWQESAQSDLIAAKKKRRREEEEWSAGG